MKALSRAIWAVIPAVLLAGGVSAGAAPRVDLVTIDAGDPVWTRFAHVGLRVVDDEAGHDVLYSYGWAPFDQPDFIWGYLRGQSEFFLAAQGWEQSLRRYATQDRTVRRRPLNLSPEQAADLARRLEHNALPENRGYRYEHLTDNCSTRVRDLLDEVTGGELRRAAAQRAPNATYRDYTLDAGSGRTLVQIIFDLIGGPSQERPVDGWAQLYLPAYLEETAAEAWLLGSGEPVPLAGPPETLNQRRGPPPITGNRDTGRWWVLGAGLVLGALLAGLGQSRSSALAVRLHGLFLLPVSLIGGLVGLALLALVIVSRVPDFAWNENVLIFWPTDLAGVWLALRQLVTGRPAGGRRWRGYLLVRLGALALYGLLKLVGVLPQDNWVFLAFAVAVLSGQLLAAGRLAARPVSRSSAAGPGGVRVTARSAR